MALSEYEKQILAEMEQHLRQQDPDLADAMSTSLPKTEESEEKEVSSPLSPRRIALGSILAAVGLALVVLGVSLSSVALTILLGAVGFAAMVGGILYALTPDKDAQGSDFSPARPPSGPRRPTKEERDEKRRQRWQNRGRQ